MEKAIGVTRPKSAAGSRSRVAEESVRVNFVPAKATARSAGIKSKAGAKARPISSKTIRPTAFYRATGFERVKMIREGVPATLLEVMVREMDISKERLFSTLRLPRATVDRKIRNNAALSAEQSERVIGLERLIGQVEVMVTESGKPSGFDSARWVGAWLERSVPALGGLKPAEFMDTMEGQEIVSRLLAQSQSGAYA